MGRGGIVVRALACRVRGPGFFAIDSSAINKCDIFKEQKKYQLFLNILKKKIKIGLLLRELWPLQ